MRLPFRVHTVTYHDFACKLLEPEVTVEKLTAKALTGPNFTAAKVVEAYSSAEGVCKPEQTCAYADLVNACALLMGGAEGSIQVFQNKRVDFAVVCFASSFLNIAQHTHLFSDVLKHDLLQKDLISLATDFIEFAKNRKREGKQSPPTCCKLDGVFAIQADIPGLLDSVKDCCAMVNSKSLDDFVPIKDICGKMIKRLNTHLQSMLKRIDDQLNEMSSWLNSKISNVLTECDPVTTVFESEPLNKTAAKKFADHEATRCLMVMIPKIQVEMSRIKPFLAEVVSACGRHELTLETSKIAEQTRAQLTKFLTGDCISWSPSASTTLVSACQFAGSVTLLQVLIKEPLAKGETRPGLVNAAAQKLPTRAFTVHASLLKKVNKITGNSS